MKKPLFWVESATFNPFQNLFPLESKLDLMM